MSGTERASVLVVEYGEELRTAYTRHLTDAGFGVAAVDNGVLALDHLRNRGAWVLVLNIGLPGMSGGDLIKEAVEIDPDLAVIALSVVNDAAIAAHCMRRGAMDFLIKPIELATGRQAYFVGKPNPLMMRHALKRLGCQREQTAIVGDRMDTDIIAGIESEIETVLVLSGVTTREDLQQFAYRPDHILDGVGAIPI